MDPESIDGHPAKHALLIGCSYAQNLPGTGNDVEAMAKLLKTFGFNDENTIKKLCGPAATREGILLEFKRLISRTSANDSVVIYYSGHGASITLDSGPEEGKTIQFLVPSDFEQDHEVFQGILDSEISKLLKALTDRTHNVTYILDCCHSARLGRAPPSKHTHGATAAETWEKAWAFKEESQSDFYSDLLTTHIQKLRKEGKLLENDNWSNPMVVRIAAAAADETAWQYKNRKGLHVGIMTEKLAQIMTEVSSYPVDQGASMSELSWRSIMMGVKALVELEFPEQKLPQKPRSGGADTRIPFDLITVESAALLAVVEESRVMLQGGRVHGVDKDDTYVLVPFTSEKSETSIIVTVKRVQGFRALVTGVPPEQLLFTQALALPCTREKRWPISVPQHLSQVHSQLIKSQFLEPDTRSTTDGVRIQHGESTNEIFLYGGETQLGSGNRDDASSIKGLLSRAQAFAQAQDFVELKRGQDTEWLNIGLKIDIGVFVDDDENLLTHYNNDG